MEIILDILGILLIFAAFIVTLWWIYTDHQNKVSAIGICFIAVFIGVIFILTETITEVTIKGVGTIKAAVKQATIDAEMISEIRERIQSQGATVDIVAQKATKVEKLVEELTAKTDLAENKLQELDNTLTEATLKLSELDRLVEFTQTVLAAQNDDRRAFEQLEIWAKDSSFSLKDEAGAAYRTVFDKHSQPFYPSGFTIPWSEGVDPTKLNISELRNTYQTVPVWLKPALLEYIYMREDLPNMERLEFLAYVVENDQSLKAVEYAGRYLTGALDLKLSPLAIQQILIEWKKYSSTNP